MATDRCDRGHHPLSAVDRPGVLRHDPFFVSHSGFLDNTGLDRDPDNPALNVNGDMEVYLPDGSEVSALIAKVEEDWTTDVMVIYIESNKNNITDQRILQEISYVEETLNPYISDAELDDVIYILSLSTVIKKSIPGTTVRTALIEESVNRLVRTPKIVQAGQRHRPSTKFWPPPTLVPRHSNSGHHRSHRSRDVRGRRFANARS